MPIQRSSNQFGFAPRLATIAIAVATQLVSQPAGAAQPLAANGRSQSAPAQAAPAPGSLSAECKLSLSRHFTKAHWDWFAKTTAEHNQWWANTKQTWRSSEDSYNNDARKSAEGSSERNYSLTRAKDCELSMDAELAEVKQSYLDEVEKINSNAESNFFRSNPSAENSQRDRISNELKQRQSALRADFERKASSIKQSSSRDIDRLKLERDSQLRNVSSDEDNKRIQGDYNEKLAVTDNKSRIQIFQYRKQYEAAAARLQASLDALRVDPRMQQSAKMVPIGNTNLYSRSYETQSDPTGYRIPYEAVPASLGQTRNFK